MARREYRKIGFQANEKCLSRELTILEDKGMGKKARKGVVRVTLFTRSFTRRLSCDSNSTLATKFTHDVSAHCAKFLWRYNVFKLVTGGRKL